MLKVMLGLLAVATAGFTGVYAIDLKKNIGRWSAYLKFIKILYK